MGGNCWSNVLELVTGVDLVPKWRVHLGGEPGQFKQRKRERQHRSIMLAYG